MRLLLATALFALSSLAIAAPRPLPEPMAGAHVYRTPDGGHIFLLPDGSTFIRFPDGVELVKAKDGTRTYTYPNGDMASRLASGEMLYTRHDGAQALADAQGKVSVNVQSMPSSARSKRKATIK